MWNRKSYRSCFVPFCTNTTKTTPDKIFLHVPLDDKRRNKWFQAVHRFYPKTKSNFFCCEDHFDLKDDMENYIYFTTMGGKAKIKMNVVPHKFDCQPNCKRRGTTTRPAAEKRRRQQIIQEILTESSENVEIGNPQGPNIDAVSANAVENIGLDLAPSNVAPGQKVTVETQTDINNCTVTLPVNSCPKYRSVSVQCKVTNHLINDNLKANTGVPEEWNVVLEHISVISNIDITNIKLSLMKIRCQVTWERLSEQFGMSLRNASIIFNKTVPVLAHLLKNLIYMPKSSKIKKILPIPFRNSYNHLIAIIDAFEIQIEKPSDPQYQSLTWSEYKKCNTLKYLISYTPDGFINFISKGFGGRISDEILFQESGLLEELPEDCAVMADRGFKNIVPLLDSKNIELIRPPSVNSRVNLSQSDVLQGKQISALRIYIERVIGRIREFDFLKPHAVVNHNMLPLTDNIVVIAAALVNLQAPIIST